MKSKLIHLKTLMICCGIASSIDFANCFQVSSSTNIPSTENISFDLKDGTTNRLHEAIKLYNNRDYEGFLNELFTEGQDDITLFHQLLNKEPKIWYENLNCAIVGRGRTNESGNNYGMHPPVIGNTLGYSLRNVFYSQNAFTIRDKYSRDKTSVYNYLEKAMHEKKIKILSLESSETVVLYKLVNVHQPVVNPLGIVFTVSSSDTEGDVYVPYDSYFAIFSAENLFTTCMLHVNKDINKVEHAKGMLNVCETGAQIGTMKRLEDKSVKLLAANEELTEQIAASEQRIIDLEKAKKRYEYDISTLQKELDEEIKAQQEEEKVHQTLKERYKNEQSQLQALQQKEQRTLSAMKDFIDTMFAGVSVENSDLMNLLNAQDRRIYFNEEEGFVFTGGGMQVQVTELMNYINNRILMVQEAERNSQFYSNYSQYMHHTQTRNEELSSANTNIGYNNMMPHQAVWNNAYPQYAGSMQQQTGNAGYPQH